MSVVVQQPSAHTSLRAEVVEAGERWCNSQRRLIRLVAELDASGEWALDGAPTCAHWVAGALDVEVSTAREWLRVGRALAELDVVDDAFEHARLSYSKVRTLTRIASAETQGELCALAEHVPAGRLGCALAAWQQRRETPQETEARQHAAESLHWHTDCDGMRVFSWRVVPMEGAALTAEIDTRVQRWQPHASADAPDRVPWPSLARQRASAFKQILGERGGTVAAELVLHVRGDGCTFDDGTPIADSIVERIAPQSFVRALIHDAKGRPINASGRRRHPTQRQQRVVRERHRACVDCGSTDLLQYDHVPPHEETSHTAVDELQLRCAVCHHRKHRNDEAPSSSA